ncbi:MAG: tRNA lysidine(34) synthetase TilS [Cellvibrionaceae bacterium]
MTSLLDTLRQFVDRQPQVKRWVVAYSGGLDSSVLLYGMAQLSLSAPLVAVHVNHGLSPKADDWQRHCEDFCRQLNVEIQGHSVLVERRGRGLEDAARAARYQVFETFMSAETGLLLAHHRNDQAETLMLRLMRGSGTRGLSAMAAERALGDGTLYRPLLDLDRQVLWQQAKDWNLSWIEDESNSDTEFDRNFLRSQVLPALVERWPNLTEQWAQSAAWCREADSLVSEVAVEDLSLAAPRSERLGKSLDLSAMASLSVYRRGNLLRLWFEQLGVSAPDKNLLNAIDSQFVEGRPDSAAELHWQSLSIRRFKQRLYFLPFCPVPESDTSLTAAAGESAPSVSGWKGQRTAWGRGWIELEAVAEGGFRMPPQGFEVSRRRQGERCHPSWRDKSQSLKKLLQESHLEPWLRDQMPCLRLDDQLLVAADLWHCRGQGARAGNGYRLRWHIDAE